jgi:hypothetical protein
MRGDRPQDALAMVAVAAVVAVLVIARHAGGWIGDLERSLHQALSAASAPRALLLGVVLVGAVVAAVLWRRRVCRDLLADRVELQLVPSPEFDPSIEAVGRLAAQLARTRRRGRGWLERPAAAVRFDIASDSSGRLGYRISAPAHAKQTLHAALGEYSELDIREDTGAADSSGHASSARCELVLARPAREPLAQLGLDPDPLQPLAAVMEGLRAQRGERVQVSVDVLALTTGEARRWRRQAQRRTRRQERRDNPQPRPATRTSSSGDPLNLNDLFARPARAARRDAVTAARHREMVDGLRVKAAGTRRCWLSRSCWRPAPPIARRPRSTCARCCRASISSPPTTTGARSESTSPAWASPDPTGGCVAAALTGACGPAGSPRPGATSSRPPRSPGCSSRRPRTAARATSSAAAAASRPHRPSCRRSAARLRCCRWVRSATATGPARSACR